MRTALIVFVLSSIIAARGWSSGLSGFVKDFTGEGVSNASVIVRTANTNREIARCKTNSAGEYRVAVLPLGEVDVLLSSPGFQTAVVREFRVSEVDHLIPQIVLAVGDSCGSSVAAEHLKVLEGQVGEALLTGFVYVGENRPLPGATVDLICVGNTPCASMITDSAGRFEFRSNLGWHSLRIRRPGYFEEKDIQYFGQAGFETVLYPIHLSRCHLGLCRLARKPVHRCE